MAVTAVAPTTTQHGGPCTVSGDAVDVEFTNAHETNPLEIAVYVTGGNEYPRVWANSDTETPVTTTTRLGKRGIDEHLLTIPVQTPGKFGASDPTPGSQKVNVKRSMAKDGVVYLFVYTVFTSPGIPFTSSTTNTLSLIHI